GDLQALLLCRVQRPRHRNRLEATDQRAEGRAQVVYDHAREVVAQRLEGPQLAVILGHLIVKALGTDLVADAKGDFVSIDWLGEKVVRSRLNAGQPVLPVGEGGDEQDENGGRGAVALQPTADLHAVRLRHQ